MAQRWRLTLMTDGSTVTYPNFDGYRWFDDGVTPQNPAGKAWQWVLDNPPPLPDPPREPTSQELADRLDALTNDRDTLVLAVRALISLLADDKSVTDAQARTAVKARMKLIAEKQRG